MHIPARARMEPWSGPHSAGFQGLMDPTVQGASWCRPNSSGTDHLVLSGATSKRQPQSLAVPSCEAVSYDVPSGENIAFRVACTSEQSPVPELHWAAHRTNELQSNTQLQEHTKNPVKSKMHEKVMNITSRWSKLQPNTFDTKARCLQAAEISTLLSQHG